MPLFLPFPIMTRGTDPHRANKWWHLAPEVDLVGGGFSLLRGEQLCRARGFVRWSGPETNPDYELPSLDRGICPRCVARVERIVAKWDKVYPEAHAWLARRYPSGHVARAVVETLGYTLPLDLALLPVVPGGPGSPLRVVTAAEFEAIGDPFAPDLLIDCTGLVIGKAWPYESRNRVVIMGRPLCPSCAGAARGRDGHWLCETCQNHGYVLPTPESA